MKNNFDTDVLIEEEISIKTKSEKEKSIVIYNDNINSFDFVIGCLTKYCGHDSLQAEQCTMIIHYAGKCSVKEGMYKDLKPIHEALLENGLTSKIE